MLKQSRISLIHEETLYGEGYNIIAGVDEAGRGPLAGPVTACAVVFPRGVMLDGVDDSKKLSPKQRAVLAERIRETAAAYAVGVVDVETIDRINILQAALLAMSRAVEALTLAPDAVLIDGNRAPTLPARAVCVPRGDAVCHSIAAASIIAKVTRDAIMEELHKKYPRYGFDRHKGYGTAAHYAALRQYGPCAVHRRSFNLGVSNG